MPHANGLSPIADMCQIQQEASRHIADAVFAGSGKIDRVMSHVAQRVVTEQLRFVKSLAVSPSVKEWAELQKDFFSRPESSINYHSEILWAFKEMQIDIGKTILQYPERSGLGSQSILPNRLKRLASCQGRQCSIH